MHTRNYILFFLLFISLIVFIYSVPIIAQQPGAAQTTANVTVSGFVDNLIVTYFPVNFTRQTGGGPEIVGISPGTNDNPKRNVYPFLNVTTGMNTNVIYNISLNATSMSDGAGHTIPVNNIWVNYTCCYLTCTQYSTPIYLSNNFQYLCRDLNPDGYAQIYFYLNIPNGQYNNTYNGNIWIYANSSLAGQGVNNRTWYGPGNTTVYIRKRIDISWTLAPIDFAVVSPGQQANATLNKGWPTNITVGSPTNVYVDLYVNGSDLQGLTGAAIGQTIVSKNITYANSTHNNYNSNGPQPPGSEYWHTLNNTRPVTSSRGDFVNWGMIPNRTDVYSYWNINVPSVEGGQYGGDVVASAVDAGTNPS